MTLKEIEELERKKLAKDNRDRQRAAGNLKQAEMPEVKNAGLIIGLTPEQRAEYFRKLREGVDQPND